MTLPPLPRRLMPTLPLMKPVIARPRTVVPPALMNKPEVCGGADAPLISMSGGPVYPAPPCDQPSITTGLVIPSSPNWCSDCTAMVCDDPGAPMLKVMVLVAPVLLFD